MSFWNRKKIHETKALTDAQILEMLGTGAPTSAGIAVSSETALRVPAVAGAVRTISEAAASLTVKVVEIADDGTETEVPNHPVAALLKHQANDFSSGFELIRSIMVDALCRDQGGLAWVNWTGGQPVEIIRYRPGYINVDYPDDSLAPRYRINGIIQAPQSVVHLKSTFDKCPVTLCREAIGAALVMEKHASKLFGSSARPGGVVEGPADLKEEGIKKLVAAWKASMEGGENAGKTAFLFGGASWKQMTLSSVDAQFQQLRLFQLQEVARGFNIPASMIGDQSRSTFMNAAEMQRQFLQLCLEPWLRSLESALRRALFLKDDRPRFAVRFERDDFSNVDLLTRATAASSLVASRLMNPNEARRDLLDMGPYPGGEQYANPHTGSSQPGVAAAPADKEEPKEEDDADAVE